MNGIGLYLSLKLRWLSFIGMWAVVGIHANLLRLGWRAVRQTSESRWETLILNIVFTFAVPLFFFISGGILSLQMKSAEFSSIRLLRKKASTLLLPYLLWCLFGALALMPIVHVNYLQYFLRPWIPEGIGCLDWLWAVFGLACGAGVLWYVRNLLLFFPVVCLLKRLLSRTWAIAVFVVVAGCVYFYLGARPFVTSSTFVQTSRLPSSVFFFLAGMLAFRAGGIQSRLTFGRAVSWSAGGLVALVGVFVLRSVIPCWKELYPVAALFVLWFGYDALSCKMRMLREKPSFLSYSFWVYCVHIYVLSAFGLVCHLSFGLISERIIYAAALVIVPPVCILLGMALERLLPRIYAVLSGGR